MNPKKPHLLVTQGLHPSVVAAFADRAHFCFTSETAAEALLQAAAEVDGILVRTPLPEDLFVRCSRLRAAVRHGVGLDMIPIDRATQAGVPVANVPGANARTVAEFVLMQMLHLSRRQGAVQLHLRTGHWSAARAQADHAFELDGATLGIVGYGAIGREVARIAYQGFRMKVLAAGRKPPVSGPDATGVTLEQLLQSSDFIVLCCPLTDDTRGLIDARAIGLMKPSAFLVNVARGPVAEPSALVESLVSGRIAGAALDVHHVVPLPPEHALWGCPNVLVTPHVAGITDTAMRRIGQATVTQALDILEGRRPQHLVNPEVWDRRRSA